MSIVETRYEHIVLNENDVPIIAGTKMKVIILILEKIAYGWSPEELKFQHPELKLGQIFSALAYYSDHKDKFDKQIEEQLKEIENLKEKLGNPSLVDKL